MKTFSKNANNRIKTFKEYADAFNLKKYILKF